MSENEPESGSSEGESAPKPKTEESRRPGTAASTQPGVEDVKAWEGYQLDEISGQGVAKVEGLFVDKQTGEPAWLLAKLGRFGKTVPVSVRECAAAAGRVWVPHDREVIRNAPAVDPAMPLNREQELQVLEYYGIPETVGRAAEIAERAEGEVTSQASG